jgi:hypothetical protein
MLWRLIRGRAVRWSVRVAVTGGIVAYILYDVDRHDLLQAMTRVRIAPVVLAFALYLVGQWLSGYKWFLLGRSVGLDRSLREYMRFYFIGMFFNLFGPSTLGGDVVRALYLGGGRRPGLALNSVLFDRVSGLALLMALGAVGLVIWGPDYPTLPGWLTAPLILGGVALALGWWMTPRLARLFPAGSRVRRQAEELGPFWRDKGMLVRISVVSIVFHLTQVGVQFILARALDVALPFSYCLILHPVISVMTALPVSIAGFGPREGGYLWFLTRVGVDDSIAVTMSLLWFGLTVAAGLVGGALFLASGAELPRLRVKPASPANRAAATG